jgi:hypothetical protein
MIITITDSMRKTSTKIRITKKHRLDDTFGYEIGRSAFNRIKRDLLKETTGTLDTTPTLTKYKPDDTTAARYFIGKPE